MPAPSSGPEAIERTLEALRDFRAVAEGAGADRILAVATSAVRDALDGRLLLDRARELGVPLQIIDGDTEARLGFVGAVHDLSVTSGATLDVGGGSAEISRFRDRRLTQTWSFELGSLRVSDRYLDDDPPTGSQLKKLRRSVAESAPRRRSRDAEERRAPDRHRRDGPQPGEDRHPPDRASAPAAARVRARRRSAGGHPARSRGQDDEAARADRRPEPRPGRLRDRWGGRGAGDHGRPRRGRHGRVEPRGP